MEHELLIKLLLDNFILSGLPVIISFIMLTCAALTLIQNGQNNPKQNTDYHFYFLIVGFSCRINQCVVNILFKKNIISLKKVEIKLESG
jgi:hypothetical protein